VNKNTTANSRLARLGFWAEFKVGFVFGKFVFNRKIPHLYSPTSPSARTLLETCAEKTKLETTLKKHKYQTN